MRKSVEKICLALAALFVLANPVNAAPHDELKYMPKETTFVIQFDLAKVQTTKLFKEVVAGHPAFGKMVAEAKRELGINPLKAIKTVTMGFGKKAGSQDMSIVLDTALDPTKAPLNKPHVKKKNHKGQAYYDLGKGGAATVIGGHTIIGSTDRLIKTLDQLKSNGALGSPIAATSKGRDAKAQLWVFGKPPIQQGMGPMAGQIEGLTGHVDFSAGIRAEFNVAGNENLVKMMAATIGMQKQMASNHPMVKSMGLDPMLKKVNVKDQGKKMSVSINLNDGDVAKLKNIVMMMMASQAMMGQPGGAQPGAMGMPPAGKPPGMTPIPAMPKAPAPKFNRPPIPPPPPAKPAPTK